MHLVGRATPIDRNEYGIHMRAKKGWKDDRCEQEWQLKKADPVIFRDEKGTEINSPTRLWLVLDEFAEVRRGKNQRTSLESVEDVTSNSAESNGQAMMQGMIQEQSLAMAGGGIAGFSNGAMAGA